MTTKESQARVRFQKPPNPFKSCEYPLLPDPQSFNDRKSLPIFNPAEEAFFKKVTFSTDSLCARSRSTLMNVKAIDHIVLTVKDLDATCAFYARVLGMSISTFGDGRRALSFGAQKINLHQSGREFEPKAKKPTPGSADLCFVTSMSVSDVVEHLRTCGVELLEGPVQRTGAVGPITFSIERGNFP